MHIVKDCTKGRQPGQFPDFLLQLVEWLSTHQRMALRRGSRYAPICMPVGGVRDKELMSILGDDVSVGPPVPDIW